MIRPSNNNSKMATVITAVAVKVPGWQKKPNENAPKYSIEAVCGVLEKPKLIVNAARRVGHG